MPESTADLERKVAQLTRELAESRQQQAATAEVLRAISGSTFDLDTVLTTLIRTAINLCQATRGVIWLRRGEQLFLAAHVNYSDEWVAFAKANPLTPSADAVTTSGLAAFTGELVHVEDVPNDPRFRSLAAHKLGDYRAGLAVPLKRGDQVVGVISLSRPEARLFTDQQVALVQTFADQAVIAIENARLFEEVQARNRDLTESLERQTAMSEILRVISSSPTDVQPVFETIAESAARLCNARFCAVFRFDGELIHFAAQHGMPPEGVEAQRRVYPLPPSRASTAARSILNAAVEQIPDVEADPDYKLGETARAIHARSILAVPMLRDGRPVGTISIARSEIGEFPARQIELVRTFADQAVIAIENVRLFEEVQARNRDLAETLQQQTATSEILRVLSMSPTDVQPVFETIVRSAVSLCTSLFANVFRFDGEMLHFVASHNVGPDYVELLKAKYPMRPDSTQVAGRVLLTKSVVRIEDVLADPDYDQRFPATMGWRRMLGVPMLRENEPFGVIVVGWAETGPVPKGQEDLLKTFADQAVIAIENVRLFDEVQARNREVTEALEKQTAMSDILRVISSSPTDVQPVFETISESAARLCEARFCSVFRFDGEFVHFMAQHGMSPEAADLQRRAFPSRPGQGSAAARAILSGSVAQVPDIEADANYSLGTLARILGARSILSVPMLRDGRPVGAINIGRSELGKFPHRQIELLKTFADQAVIAIENVRLFEEVQTRNRDLAETLEQQVATSAILSAIAASPTDIQPVLDAVTESAAQLIDAYDTTIFLRREDVLDVASHRGAAIRMDFDHLPLRRDVVTSRAVLDRKTIHVHDLMAEGDEYPTGQALARQMGFRTTLATPLLREGEAIGALMIRRTEVRPFSDRQVQLLRTFADQAVIAIENVRLFEEVQARTAELSESLQQQTATADVLKAISRSTFDLDTVLKTLIESATRLCDTGPGQIWRRDGDVYRLAATQVHDPEYEKLERQHEIRPGRGTLVGRALLEGRAVQIVDVLADPEYELKEEARIGNFRSGLGVPLLRSGEPIGAFAFGRHRVEPFTDRQIELVKTFADQAVIAIENVRLFEEVQARTAELSESLQQQTATADVLKVISRSAFDLPSVLQTLVDSAVRLCGADMGAITLRQGDRLRFKAGAGQSPELRAYEMTHPHPLSRGTFQGRAAVEGKTIHIPNVLEDAEYERREATKHFGAVLSVPLKRGAEVIGVFGLARRTVGPFGPRQIELVENFADQAVIAIENVRLFDEVQARTRDLTRSLEELQNAQDRLVQTEKLASLGQLTAGIAHEIKNPLNFVNNFSALSAELVGELQEILGRAPLAGQLKFEIDELSGVLKSNLEKVTHHGKRADSIVKNMLLHSRQGSGEHRPSDINAIVEESLNLAYHGARAEKKGFNITLEKSLDPAAGEVDIYPQEITRVLINLISNGFYATTKRNAEANGAPYEPVLVAATRNLGDSVEIRIRDNGTGISPAVKERMFNPFFTTKPVGEGTGLGLSLSHDIVVKQHAGTIQVESEPGSFTEFRIVLPRRAASLAKSGGNA